MQACLYLLYIASTVHSKGENLFYRCVQSDVDFILVYAFFFLNPYRVSYHTSLSLSLVGSSVMKDKSQLKLAKGRS